MPNKRNTSLARLAFIVVTVAVAMFGAAPSAQAASGNWEWGPPGFSAAWTADQRLDYIVQYGIADPAANYWTPFWSGAGASNVYTNVPDTGARNTFAVNHDINTHYGIPLLGYLDIVTPLLGTNELQIAATVSSIWTSITDCVSSIWTSITDLFTNEYDSYESSGWYDSGGGWDNGFDSGYGGYGYGGW
ncbi:MAG: hypothetical protein R3B06_02355 [Kofleriaceae bacterium]